jgi:hypothetical protein
MPHSNGHGGEGEDEEGVGQPQTPESMVEDVGQVKETVLRTEAVGNVENGANERM